MTPVSAVGNHLEGVASFWMPDCAFQPHQPVCILHIPPYSDNFRYPVEGVSYFLEPSRVCIPAYINLFMALLDMPAAQPLREQLAVSQDKLIMLLGMPQQHQQQAAAGTAGQNGGSTEAPMAVDGAVVPAGGCCMQNRVRMCAASGVEKLRTG